MFVDSIGSSTGLGGAGEIISGDTLSGARGTGYGTTPYYAGGMGGGTILYSCSSSTSGGSVIASSGLVVAVVTGGGSSWLGVYNYSSGTSIALTCKKL